ncbi:MAG: 4a-hydroxytetrahydrobiopterin dehydratase [Bacteroidota bacterium]|nr:4a-hydroxytetrahydrobiopterin dehydratase [Bacteroidota bacterium]
MIALTETDIRIRLNDLEDWTFLNNQIYKDYIFADFNAAIEFVNQIAVIANEIDHHPDILIHSYKKVKIMLSTHDAGGITENDFKLAGLIEQLIK